MSVMDEPLEFELLDKHKVIDWLMKMENGAINSAMDAKMHVAVQAYAQAAAFKYIADTLIAGGFDLDTGTKQ